VGPGYDLKYCKLSKFGMWPSGKGPGQSQEHYLEVLYSYYVLVVQLKSHGQR